MLPSPPWATAQYTAIGSGATLQYGSYMLALRSPTENPNTTSVAATSAATTTTQPGHPQVSAPTATAAKAAIT